MKPEDKIKVLIEALKECERSSEMQESGNIPGIVESALMKVGAICPDGCDPEGDGEAYCNCDWSNRKYYKG